MEKLFKEKDLVFTPLFKAQPHVFLSTQNPLAEKESITLEELEDYPYLSYEQGQENSFYFAEEIIEIADNVEAESASVAKAKLQIDARKWAASKIAPKKYGDKTELDVKSSDGSMTPTVRLDAEEYRKIAEDVLRKI